jgi:thiol:disulfide interchange protein DsbD
MQIVAVFLILGCFILSPATAAEDISQAAKAERSIFDVLKGFGRDNSNSDDFLHPDEAFVLLVEEKGPTALLARWDIAEGYYLYRDKFSFKLNQAGVRLGQITLPPGKVKDDPTFGPVEIHTGRLEIEVPLIREVAAEELPLELKVSYQGCAEEGICYPPIDKTVPLKLAAFTSPGGTSKDPSQGPTTSAEDKLALQLAEGKIGWILASFLGFGLLLSFTPCIFPTIPILSGIIVGQAERLTTRRAFGLSLVFVLAMAVTYAVMGVIAGLFGQNVQAVFQNQWILIAFAGLFVLLALSMFGLFEVQLPTRWQTELTRISNNQSGGAFHGVAAMGALSALIVGPCMAPPLAGALIYIGQTGDAVLGGSALFTLGIGMGIPLLVVGTSAGKLLPKVGAWMQTIKAVFGVVLLGIAIWLLERVLPGPVILLLWGLLLIVCAIYMGALDTLERVVSGGRRLAKGLGLAVLTYGVLLIVGAASGANDIFRPLGNIALMTRGESPALRGPAFKPVKGVEGLKQALMEAQGKPVMLDFYAEWCVECKQMEQHTFADADVQQALAGMVLLKADVTANDKEDRALLKTLGLYGPPATLFFGAEGSERRGQRLVGFMGAGEFRAHLEAVLRRS